MGSESPAAAGLVASAVAAVSARLESLAPGTRRGLGDLLAAATWYGSLELSDVWTSEGTHQPILWLPIGVGFALIAARGRRLAAVFALVTILEALRDGHGAGGALVFGAGQATAALLMVEAARRLRALEGETAADTLARLAAAALAAAVGSATALAAVALEGALHGGAAAFWLHVGLADLAGIAIAAPLLRWGPRRGRAAAARPPELIAVPVVAAGLAELVFSGTVARGGPLAYLVFAPVLWAALRAGRRGVSLASFAVAIVAASNLAHGNGPFVTSGVDRGVALDAFLVTLSFTGLVLVGVESARRESEAAVRRSEERFRALVENSTDIVTVLSPEGIVRYAGPSVLGSLGYTPAELEGTDVFTLVHPDDLAAAAEAFTRLLEGGEADRVALRYRHGDGRWLDFEATGRNLVDEPVVGGILVNARDVTERRRAERQREEAERRYRTLVERLPLVTYVNGVAPHEPPRYVSPQVEALLGYPVSDWYSERSMSRRVVHPDDAELLEELMRNEEPADVRDAEYRMLAADGSVVWVLDRMVRIRDEHGEPVAVQGFIVDITEQKRLEQQLRRAQRLEAIGLLAGGVAHDFNNLLTAIAGYAELARAAVDDRADVVADLDEVLRAADRASALTRQLLAFGRRRVLQEEVVDPNAVVLEAEQLLSRLIGEDVEVVTRLDPELGRVRADAWQLGQVLVNLAVNARDAMPAGGRLTISTANETLGEGGGVAPGEYVVLSVADTGVGIEPTVLERLFEPFFTTKAVGEGTGLGLSMVYGIVKQSGGYVVVRSEPGEGAEFRVLLPRTREPGSEEPPPAALPAGGRETVLLVEDEDVVRDLTGEMLERQGYRVLAAGSPEEALAVSEPYELLLTDVVMPGMTGPDLAELLAARRPGLGVLFVSGYSGSAVADPADLPGDLLEKPFTLDVLARKVREALDGSRSDA